MSTPCQCLILFSPPVAVIAVLYGFYDGRGRFANFIAFTLVLFEGVTAVTSNYRLIKFGNPPSVSWQTKSSLRNSLIEIVARFDSSCPKYW